MTPADGTSVGGAHESPPGEGVMPGGTATGGTVSGGRIRPGGGEKNVDTACGGGACSALMHSEYAAS